MGKKIVFLMNFITILALAPFSNADEGYKGVSCLKKYAEYIHQDVTFSSSLMQDITTAIQTHFKSIGNVNTTLASIQWLVAGIPFGVAVVDSVVLIIDVYELVKESIGLIQNEVREHKFGRTFEMMAMLHQFAEELNHSTEELAKGSELIQISTDQFKNYKSYQNLIKLIGFQTIAQATKTPPEKFPELSQEVLEQYLFGDLFCGATDMFEPMSIDDLAGYQFSQIIVTTGISAKEDTPKTSIASNN